MKYVIGTLQWKLPLAPQPFNPALLSVLWFQMVDQAFGAWTTSFCITGITEHKLHFCVVEPCIRNGSKLLIFLITNVFNPFNPAHRHNSGARFATL